MLDTDEADRALAELGADSDRMAEALVAMDGHAGHRLLKGADLTGVTARRWAEASAAMSVLWEQFARHRDLVEHAREIRARKARPGPPELTELTTALGGELAELATSMKKSLSTITQVLDAAEKSWQETAERLDPLDTRVRSAQALAESLGVEEPRLARLIAELAGLRQSALSDPLAADVRVPERLAAELADVQATLDDLVAVRDDFADRQQELEAVVDRIAAVEAEVRTVQATVLEKIASPDLTPPGKAIPALRARLTELADIWQARRWQALSRKMSTLDRDAQAALDDVRAQLAFATGLLDRRLELRGRLDAYRAKARQLGHVEDLDLAGLHATAYQLLYTIPCDLRAATIAVRDYQRALQERREERG
ncbi:hypothetical protein [Amycolatopsis sp. GM8]|uniref:hypothetical protein n=1 Tax=Amycolatopsis sp. GM8 TaxID=2896530 RepID=UPI001F3B2AAB|nr:hypothetical protein [Amycolatopsis sp. GM8]